MIVALAAYPQTQAAPEVRNIFKSSDFLAWDMKNRELYIRTSVGVAGYIALENDKNHGQCIENWYYPDQRKSNDYIFEAMQRFPDAHPRAVIMAALVKKCGSFEYTK